MIYRDYLKAKNQNSIKFKEAEGSSPLAFSHSKGRDLKNYQIYGNSTQKTTGKNLISSLPYYNPTPDDNFSVIFEKGKTYTFSFESSTSSKWRLMIWGTEIDGSDLNTGSNAYLQGMYCSAAAPNRLQDSADRTTNSYTYLCNKSFVAVRIAFWNTDNGASDTITNPQLELGSTATDYEAYHTSPSPEFPSEVESVGDLTTKNLLPNDWEEGFISTSSGANQNSSTYVRTKDYFAFDISKNYYISSDSIDTSTTISWYFYDENKNFISRFVSYKNRTIGTSDCQVTIPTNAVFFRLAVLTTDITIKVQLEEGSTATEYEPYHKYDVSVTVHGKNLFDKSKSNSVNIQEESATSYWGSLIFENKNVISMLKPNATYTISYDIECVEVPTGDNITINSAFAGIAFYSGASGYSSYFTYKSIQLEAGNTYHIEQTFTTDYKLYDSSANYRFLAAGNRYYDENNKAYYSTVIIRNIQIEEGTTATSYELYKGKTTKHIYLDEPLRKIGDYADYIDFKNQKVVRNIVEDSLYANTFYKKLSSVARFGRTKTNIKQKLDTHMLSTILNYDFSWYKDVESIFHHDGAYYNYYWSVYWSRLGLTYDGTNMYRTDDTEQTPLTNSEVLNIANEWLKTLSDEDKKVFMILDTPTEESISLPTLKTVKGTSIMSVDTTIQSSNMKIKYVRL